MSGDGHIDQDDLAAAWGAELGEDFSDAEDGASDGGGDGGMDQDDLAAAWAAELEGESGGGDQDDLAAAWAAELEGESSGGGGGGGLDENVAAQWSAMVESDPGSADQGAHRILNQEEIDNLLGFELDENALEDSTGIRAIINSGVVSYERLPMLEIIFERLVRMLTSSLRNFTSDNVEVSLDTLSNIRFGDYLNSIPLPAMIAVFKAEEWDNYGLITVESNLIYSIVDVLLGGRGSRPIRVEGRPYTTIESSLVQRLIEVILEDMEKAFAPVSQVSFSLDRLETNPRFAGIAREANAAIQIQLRIDMEDRGGRVEVLLPYSTLEPIRDLLLQGFLGEKFGQDSIWEEHLATEIWASRVTVEAVLDELTLPLHKVRNLAVGDILMMNVGPESPVVLRSGGVPLATGNMGRVDDQIAIRLHSAIHGGEVKDETATNKSRNGEEAWG